MALFLGRHLLTIGSYDEAEPLLEHAWVLARESSDIANQIQVLIALSYVQKDMGHDQKSLNSTQQAIDLLKKADKPDPDRLGKALYGKGWAQFRLGQAQDALDTAIEGYKVSKAADLPRELAGILNLMGVVNYYLLGNYDIAAPQLKESLAIFRELGSRSNQSAVLNNMGENSRLQGDYSLAAAYYEEALEIARETENRTHENVFISNLCGTRLRLGSFEAAAADLERLIARTPTDWYGASEAYRFLAEAYLGLGKTSQALEKAQQALNLAPENTAENGRAWRVLGYIAAQSGQPVQAHKNDDPPHDAPSCFHQSITIFNELNLERDRAISLWRLAHYELAQGSETQGQELYQQARALFGQLHLPLFIAKMDHFHANGMVGNRFKG